MGTPTEASGSHTVATLLGYFKATRHHPSLALRGVIHSRYCTPQILADALRIATEWGGDRLVVAAAAASRHAEVDQVHQWVCEDEQHISTPAAQNPILGPDRVAHLWDTTRHPALLTNPHIDPDLLEANVAEFPHLVASNPAAPEPVLREIARSNLARVLPNPACPRDLLERYLDSVTNAGVWAATNPQLTLDELCATRERHATAGHAHGTCVVCEQLDHCIDEHLVVCDPRAVRTCHVSDLDVVDPVAAALADPDTDTAQAVRALLDAEFDGTVGELLECADAVTDP